MQVMQHLADLESFCTRVQVLLQQRERRKLEETFVSKRSNTLDGKDGDEDVVGDELGEEFGAEKGAKPVAEVKSAAAAATAAKAPLTTVTISVPNIRDDDDSYFGDEVDVPVELHVLRSQVMKARHRRLAVVQVMPNPLARDHVINAINGCASPPCVQFATKPKNCFNRRTLQLCSQCIPQTLLQAPAPAPSLPLPTPQSPSRAPMSPGLAAPTPRSKASTNAASARASAGSGRAVIGAKLNL
jgi:hypothetical protein